MQCVYGHNVAAASVSRYTFELGGFDKTEMAGSEPNPAGHTIGPRALASPPFVCFVVGNGLVIDGLVTGACLLLPTPPSSELP